jgi:hypothetical protein
MAKKDDDKDEDKKKKEAAAEEKDEDQEKDEPSTDVDVEVEGEESSKPKKKEAKAEDDESDEEPESETPEEKEQRLSRSQRRKAHRREVQEQKDRELAALRAQNAELARRVGSIEERGFNADVSNIDASLYESQRQMQEAKDIIKRATEEKNGEALAQAQEAWYEARTRAEKLLAYKQSLAQKAQEPAPKAPDPLLVRHARDWMSKNRWYDPRGFDQDSKIALSIDQALASDGWDPRTQEYWDEFSDRVAKYLPHRMNGQRKAQVEEEEEETSSQTRGSGRESGGGTATKTTFRVSKDRVDAMKEAGQWEQFNSDKAFRNRMIKRFREADEKHAAK